MLYDNMPAHAVLALKACCKFPKSTSCAAADWFSQRNRKMLGLQFLMHHVHLSRRLHDATHLQTANKVLPLRCAQVVPARQQVLLPVLLQRLSQSRWGIRSIHHDVCRTVGVPESVDMHLQCPCT
jgi:hypothetical protein